MRRPEPIRPPIARSLCGPDAEDAWEALQHMAELGVPPAAQRNLMGDNARRLYGIEPVMVVKERIENYAPAILPW